MASVKLSESQHEGAVKWGSGILFFLIGGLLVIQPGIEKTNLIKKRNEEARKRSELTAQILRLRKEYEKLDEFLLPKGDRHRFLGKVTALTKAGGQQIVSLQPSEETGEYYTRLILNLNVQTAFLSLVEFLNRLEEVKPLILASGLKMRSPSQREPGSQARARLEASLTLESYMKREGP
jgi:hypothetical protein